MRILIISAHADDAELGLGGTIAKHVCEGDFVNMLLITHSAYDDYDGNQIRSKETAQIESAAAVSILGISQVDCLNYKTKEVFYDVKLIEDINRHVDNFKPDIIYTHWDGDANQDHSAISQATVIGARNFSKILMYRSNWHQTLKPFVENFYVDISDHIETKMSAISQHKSEVTKRGKIWQDYFKAKSRTVGIEMGVDYGEVFQVHRWTGK
jgi:N-acetylglucosamine malate deacetylase 1